MGYGQRSGTNLTKAGTSIPTSGLITTAQSGSKSIGEDEGAGAGERDPTRNDGIFMNILTENRGPGQREYEANPTLRAVQFE